MRGSIAPILALLDFRVFVRAVKVAAGQADGISPRTIEVFQVKTATLSIETP